MRKSIKLNHEAVPVAAEQVEDAVAREELSVDALAYHHMGWRCHNYNIIVCIFTN
jgi:hypothetical protein